MALQHELKTEHGIHAQITASGQAGRPASGALHPLRQALGLGGSNNSPTYVLILLGANDVLSYFSRAGGPPAGAVDKLISDLKGLHGEVKSTGATSIALGLLEHPAMVKQAGGRDALRAVNKRIEAEAGADAFIDTMALLPSSKPSFWSAEDGGIHPVLPGYRALGKHLAGPLAEILHEHKTQ